MLNFSDAAKNLLRFRALKKKLAVTIQLSCMTIFFCGGASLTFDKYFLPLKRIKVFRGSADYWTWRAKNRIK